MSQVKVSIVRITAVTRAYYDYDLCHCTGCVFLFSRPMGELHVCRCKTTGRPEVDDMTASEVRLGFSKALRASLNT